MMADIDKEKCDAREVNDTNIEANLVSLGELK